jgi:hypothetical protein
MRCAGVGGAGGEAGKGAFGSNGAVSVTVSQRGGGSYTERDAVGSSANKFRWSFGEAKRQANATNHAKRTKTGHGESPASRSQRFMTTSAPKPH